MAAFGGESLTIEGLEQLPSWRERGEFDLIAVGTAFIADSDWVEKNRTGDVARLEGYESTSLAGLIGRRAKAQARRAMSERMHPPTAGRPVA